MLPCPCSSHVMLKLRHTCTEGRSTSCALAEARRAQVSGTGPTIASPSGSGGVAGKGGAAGPAYSSCMSSRASSSLVYDATCSQPALQVGSDL